MKKFLSLTLACTIALSAVGTIAMAQDVEEGIMPINLEEEVSYVAQTQTLRGTLTVTDEEVKLVEESGREIVLNTDEQTAAFIGAAYGSFAEKKAELNGKQVAVAASTAMTRSIPAQVAAYAILAADETANPIFIEVAGVEMADEAISVHSADGEYIAVYAQDAKVTPIRTRNIVAAAELKAGDRMVVYSSIMTMSIPAQLNPETTILVHQAEAAVEAEDVNAVDYLVEQGLLKGTGAGLELDRTATNAEALTMAYRVTGKEVPVSAEGHWADALIADATQNGFINQDATTNTIYGALNVTDEAVMIKTAEGEEFQINFDGNTVLFQGQNFDSFEAKAAELNGKDVAVAASRMMTRSLPAQVYAHAVLAASETANPIYVEVADVVVEDGILMAYSADGQYKISLGEQTAIRPLKTRNIITAQDIKKGDKLVAFSSMMTMSIPALVNADQVVVLEQSVVFNADEVINTNAFLNIINSMVEGKDLTAFASDDLMSREAMANICYSILK